MRTRWLVLAGAILALNAPALDVLALRLSKQGLGRPPVGGTVTQAGLTLTPELAAYLVTAFVPLAMAFGRLRENPAGRLTCLTLFFVVALFWMVHGGLYARYHAPYLFSLLIGGAGMLNVLGQLCTRLGLRVAAGTARVWLGVLLLWVTLDGWLLWDFDPRLLGTYAGLAGGGLIAFGEWRGLWEHVGSP